MTTHIWKKMLSSLLCGILSVSCMTATVFAIDGKGGNAFDLVGVCELIATADLALHAERGESIGKFACVYAVCCHPGFDALFLEQVGAILVNRLEYLVFQPLQIASGLQCVIQFGGIAPGRTAKADGHFFQDDIGGQFVSPQVEQGVEICAVRAAIAEKLENLDLAGAFSWLGRVEQNELLSCRLRPQGAGQAAGAKRQGSGEKMAAFKMWVVHT